MLRAAAVPLLLALVALGGCLGGGGAKEPDEGTTTPTTPTPGTPPSVSILNYTESTTVGGRVNVTWRVDGGTNTTVNVTSTAVYWGNESVPDPQSPDDYNNTSGRQLDTVPGTFNTSFEVDQPVPTLYLRAHALIEAQDFWSDEVMVEVEGGAPGEVHTVDIVGVGALSEFDPDPLTITAGDGVKWKNSAAGGFQHTATSDAGAPMAFDTGSIGPGQESAVFVLTEPGTYDYHCSFHPTTMRAEIVVQEGP